IEQQTTLDESLVPSSQSLRIGRSNFRLPSDIQSKEATLQVVYDILRNSPLFRAFQVTVDVPEIYMQDDGIRYLTDVNVNKLYQPWRSFASVINKCLTGKSSGVDSFRLSQAQMLWGFYHRINIDFAYLLWEDFVYQVEHKSQKRSNEMNYPRFTKVIIDYFMTRKPSISATQQYGAILPIELTTAKIRNSKAYQEYYACAMGEAAPKPKVSARKEKGDSASSTTPPTPTPTTTAESAPRRSASAKGSDKDSDETVKYGAGKDGDEDDDKDDDDDNEEEETAKDDEEDKETGKGGEEVTKSGGESEKEEETSEEEEGSFDPIPRTPE
nr:hypothetical protein [Tanacetum cinerariifolium]